MPGEISYAAAAVIYFEKDASDNIYLLRNGSVELTREVAGIAPRVLSTGEFVGLSEALGGGPRIASARSLTDVTVTVISIDELKNMLTSNVQIGLKVITSLCAELRDIDEMIVMRMRGGATEGGEKLMGLLMIANHFRDKNMIRAARYAYGRFLETDPPMEQQLDAALQLGMMCEKDGEIEIAQQIYGGLVREFPDDARAQTAYNRLKNVLDKFGDRL